jgi:hypothetical protein
MVQYFRYRELQLRLGNELKINVNFLCIPNVFMLIKPFSVAAKMQNSKSFYLEMIVCCCILQFVKSIQCWKTTIKNDVSLIRPPIEFGDVLSPSLSLFLSLSLSLSPSLSPSPSLSFSLLIQPEESGIENRLHHLTWVVSVLARVTRSVCEKIPQSVAKYIFVNITKCFVLAPEKSNPKMGAACVIFF